MSEYFIDQILKIKKLPGKGGWSYVEIEGDFKEYRQAGGWIKVKGFIDNFELPNYKLAPMCKGKMMLPIRADIRKALKKEEGDTIQVKLALDYSHLIIPEEIKECLEFYPKALEFFKTLTESNKRYYIDWISETKNPDTQANRINKMIDRLLEGKKMYDV